jgi:hypothetical protein
VIGPVARAAALAAVALLVPACNLTLTTDVQNPNPGAPQNPFVLQLPLDNATGISTTNTQFSWGPLDGATNYRLQIALGSAFTTILYDDATIMTTFVTLNLPLTSESDYYWRIYGIGAGPPVLAGGSPFHFMTLFPPPANPAQFFLQQPTGTGVSTTPTFGWTSSYGASRYWLQVDTSLLFAAPVVDLPNLHWNQVVSPAALIPSTTYYWRVTATNSFATTSSSPPSATFTTAP